MNLQRKFGNDIIVHWKDRKRWCGMPLSFTRYYIVEKPNKWIKLFCETGFLTNHYEEIQLYRIEDFSIRQTLTNKIWGVATIMVKSNDRSTPTLNLTRITKPYQVYELLSSLVTRDRTDKNFRWSEFQDSV
jgi:hypothetical protein